MVDIASLNRATWSRADVVAEFGELEGWISKGERAAFLAAAPHVRGTPALDIGVGAGRTVSLVRLLTDDYRGIDFVGEMVALCRRLHPDADVSEGDARDLSRFADGTFGFVLFSFSGIDAVGHTDRATVLREIRRVLRPGAVTVLSTHNLDGPSARAVPWRGSSFAAPRWYRALRWSVRAPMRSRAYVVRWRNWWVNRALAEHGDGWAVRTSSPHDFGIVIHYVALDALLAELDAAGFDGVEVYDSEDGRVLRPGDDVRHVHAFHVVARRRSE